MEKFFIVIKNSHSQLKEYDLSFYKKEDYKNIPDGTFNYLLKSTSCLLEINIKKISKNPKYYKLVKDKRCFLQHKNILNAKRQEYTLPKGLIISSDFVKLLDLKIHIDLMEIKISNKTQDNIEVADDKSIEDIEDENEKAIENLLL